MTDTAPPARTTLTPEEGVAQETSGSRVAVLHELKCWPEYFEAVQDGRKTFELRLDDRNYQVGDTLRLMEYDPPTREFTGRDDWRLVTYILRGRPGEPKDPISLRAGVASIAAPEADSFSYVILPGWVVLGIALLNSSIAPPREE